MCGGLKEFCIKNETVIYKGLHVLILLECGFSGKVWGSVVVIKNDEDFSIFPMESTVMALGSARSNDIIVRGSAAHEILLEINRFGEILDMMDNETEMLETHLGHDPKTHKENYRLTHSTRELSLVSHLLLLIESGAVNKWKGKELSEVPIEDEMETCDLVDMNQSETSQEVNRNETGTSQEVERNQTGNMQEVHKKATDT